METFKISRSETSGDSWDFISMKMDFCKLLVDLLMFNYYQNNYNCLEGFLILKFIDAQNIYLSKSYENELNSLKKDTFISEDLDYKTLNNMEKSSIMIKAIVNVLSNQLSNKKYIFYNKTTLLNLLKYLNILKNEYKLNLKHYENFLECLIYEIENTVL